MTPLESLDKALRDFGDVVPEDVRDAALAVASDLAAERKRREGLEDEIHLERLAHTAAVTRAEKAERERDNIQKSAAHWKEAKELAEADNAALLARLERLKAQRNELAGRLGAYTVPDDREADHPGTALLERVRVLESIAQQIIEHWETKPRAGMAYIVMEARMALKETP